MTASSVDQRHQASAAAAFSHWFSSFIPLQAGQLVVASTHEFACWQADNPWSETSDFEVLLALVALPLPSRQVRWIRIESLNGAR